MGKEKITVIGAGYVGLVLAGCLAEADHDVICIDSEPEKISELNNGRIPIFEPGLEEVIANGMLNGKLRFETDLSIGVRFCDVIFITVGTPSDRDGKTNLENINSVARSIGQYMNGYKVIANKSTVPVGTAKNIDLYIRETLQARDTSIQFDVVANPEFLSEGDALRGFRYPRRIVLGARSERAFEVMSRVYGFYNRQKIPFLHTDPETAEMIKYAANAFLAMKVSFINEIANLCEKLGADIRQVARGIGMDSRIGRQFLKPGPGYGGSCFPKDTRSLAYHAKEAGQPLLLVEATIKVNNMQPAALTEKIVRALGASRDKTVCFFGLTFKPDTDDIRESPSLAIVRELAARGIRIKAYDPHGNEKAKSYFAEIAAGGDITLFSNPYETARQADAIVLGTDWASFKALDLNFLRKLVTEPIFFDLRNMFNRTEVEKAGFRYYDVGGSKTSS